MIFKGEIPMVLLFKHISLPQNAQWFYFILVVSPYFGHSIHGSSKDYWNIGLRNVFHCFDDVFVCLPLTYLKELEFLKQRFDFIFTITIRVVTCCIIKIEGVSCFCLLN